MTLQIKPFQKYCPLQTLHPHLERIKIKDQEKKRSPLKKIAIAPPPRLFLFISFEFSLTVTQGATVGIN